MADMTYKHGVYGQLGDEVLSNVATAEAAAVYVGAAPLHLASDTGSEYVNKPVRVTSMRDVRRHFGYTEVAGEWEKYSLLQVFDRHFNSGSFSIAPIYVINVFDPDTMRGAAPVSGYTSFTNRVMTIKNKPNIILSSIAIDGYANGEHYKVTYSEQSGTVTIRDISPNGIPLGTSMSYYECDPSQITADLIIGEEDTETDKATGVKAIKYLYPTYNAYPMWLCVPGWSGDPGVVTAMYEAATNVNGHWNAFCVTDIPLEGKIFSDFSYSEFVITGDGFSVNLNNANIHAEDVDFDSVKFYTSTDGETWTVDSGNRLALTDPPVTAVTASTAATGVADGVTYVTAKELGSPETLGYKLAFKIIYDSTDEGTYRFVLYKGMGDFTDANIYWDSTPLASKTAVINAYNEAIHAETDAIDDIITINAAAEWPEETVSTTYFTDGLSKGDNIIVTNTTANKVFAKITFASKPRVLDTRDKVIDFMPGSVYANEINKPCWPLVANGTFANGDPKIYNISTLYTAEALARCAANGGIPFETPSNRRAPVTALNFGDYGTVPFDIEGANELNAAGVCTALQWGGWRVWGNGTGAFAYGGEYPQRARFDTNIVMQLFLCNDFQTFFMEEIDKPMTMSMIQSIVARYQTRLDAIGAAMLHARISFIRDENPTSELMEGNFVFQLDNTPAPPLNSATVTVIYTDEGFNNFFEEAV